MPANSSHPEYDTAWPAWLRARDVLAGEDAVKAAGERYLPKLQDQTSEEYTSYKQRASFFNATARTADGFVGLIFRRRPTVRLPEGKVPSSEFRVPSSEKAQSSEARTPSGTEFGLERALGAFLTDMDLLGTSVTGYAKEVVAEIMAVGRAGTLVEWEDQSEQRAYAVRYPAEQILNWHTERVNGRNTLTLVALKENTETLKGGGDDFERELVEQIRVLKLVQGNARPHPGPLPLGLSLRTF